MLDDFNKEDLKSDVSFFMTMSKVYGRAVNSA